MRLRPNQTMYDYDTYESGDNSENSGSDDSGSSGGSYEPDVNLTVTPYAPIEGTITRVFGNQNSWGQSLGIKMENVVLKDGVLYLDPEKGKHKAFNWEEVAGVMPSEDHPVSKDDANKFLTKNYGGTSKRYELVGATVMANGDDPVEVGDVVLWYGGSDQYGPKSAAKTLSKVLTSLGRNATVDESDIHNWLSDTTGDNILRDDLQGKEVAFFEVKKQSNQSDRQYHHPIVKDLQTGADVTVRNADSEGGQQAVADGSGVAAESPSDASPSGTIGGDSEDDSASEEGFSRSELEAMSYNDLQTLAANTEGVSGNGKKEELVEGILATTGGSGAAENPAPVEDFISTCQNLGYTERSRAEGLLTDLINDAGNDMTLTMVESVGGTDAVLDRVVD